MDPHFKGIVMDGALFINPQDIGSVISELEKNGYKVQKAPALPNILDIILEKSERIEPMGALVFGHTQIAYVPLPDTGEHIQELLQEYIV